MTFREICYDIEDGVCTVTELLGADHPLEAHRLDSQAMFWTGRSADAREGVSAFLEKRPARFTLRPSADLPPFYPWWQPRPFRSSRD